MQLQGLQRAASNASPIPDGVHAMRTGILMVSIMLAACTVERDTSRVYTATGVDLGASALKVIPMSESKVSFTGPDDPVSERKAQNLKDRYEERLTLRIGASMIYGKLFPGPGFVNSNVADSLKGMIDAPYYKQRGIVFDAKSLKRAGQFSYFFQASDVYTCFVYRGTFGFGNNARADSPGNQEAYGGVCYGNMSSGAKTLEDDMRELLARVRFDNGEINKARAASAVPPPVKPATP